MYNGFNIFLISFRFRVIFDKLADQKPKSNIFSFFWEGSTKVVIDKKKNIISFTVKENSICPAESYRYLL